MELSGLETGTVIEVTGTRAKVRVNKSSACKECGKAQAGICGKSGEGMVMEVRNKLNAGLGDMVTIDLERKVHVAGYFLVFISPVLALFFFAYIGHEMSVQSGIQNLDVILGITGLVFSILFSLLKIKKMDSSAEMNITRIVSQPSRSDNDPIACS